MSDKTEAERRALPWYDPEAIPRFEGDATHCRHPKCRDTNWGGRDRVHRRSSTCPPITTAADQPTTEPSAVLDRVTDLFETWAAEEQEHRRTGSHGIAEGLRIAIDGLQDAVHGAAPQPAAVTERALREQIARDIERSKPTDSRAKEHREVMDRCARIARGEEA